MTTTANALTRASRVHNALAVIAAATNDLPASVVSVDGIRGRIIVIAPTGSDWRWHDRFPDGVRVAGSLVPLHVAVEGDVEGGAA